MLSLLPAEWGHLSALYRVSVEVTAMSLAPVFRPLLITVLLQSLPLCPAQTPKELHIMGFFDFSGGWPAGVGCYPAAVMALEDINGRSDILAGYRLVMHMNDTKVGDMNDTKVGDMNDTKVGDMNDTKVGDMNDTKVGRT